jgi:ribosomal protein S27E
MVNIQAIRCPNCGNHAQRQFHVQSQVTETSCPVCDYLLVSCSRTGNVLESYAPGLSYAPSLKGMLELSQS